MRHPRTWQSYGQTSRPRTEIGAEMGSWEEENCTVEPSWRWGSGERARTQESGFHSVENGESLKTLELRGNRINMNAHREALHHGRDSLEHFANERHIPVSLPSLVSESFQ